MAFQFNLLDVQFRNDERDGIGNRGFRNLSGSDYDRNLRYPLDLGNTDKSHYAIFTIYEQQVTNFSDTPASTTETESQGMRDLGTLKKQNVVSIGDTVGTGAAILTETGSMAVKGIAKAADKTNKILGSDGLRNALDVGATVSKNFYKQGLEEPHQNLSQTNAKNFNRKIKKIKESIALYLPDSLNFGYNQGYTDVSMYSGKMGLGATAISALDQIKGINSKMSGTDIMNQIAKVAGTNLSPFLSYGLSQTLGAPGSVIAAQAFGGVQNPMLEMIYTSPSFRDFRFDFMFYPRNVDESREVWKIINSFKFHSAPEIKPGTAGFFLVPPSVFNIEFYYNGEKNPNLPLLSDCVLTGIEVDYSPNGWASYEVPGKNSPDVGGTGAPVATRLTLSFKETVILTKGLHQPDQKNYNSRVNR